MPTQFELFGLTLTLTQYIIVFFVCQLINVALNTIKTIIMHKEQKVSSSLINAITYGFYTIIVVMTASALPLLITIIITIITNLIGVYTSMLVLEKLKKDGVYDDASGKNYLFNLKKDSLWEIVATVKYNKTRLGCMAFELTQHKIKFNMVDTWDKSETIFHIYSENQKQSVIIKNLLDKYGAKYIVHQESVRLKQSCIFSAYLVVCPLVVCHRLLCRICQCGQQSAPCKKFF